MASKKFGFPPGVFFTPTDRQLIEFYLKPKILGHDLKFDVVENKQIYGPNSNPWQVLDLDDDDCWFDCADKESERIRLVFTELLKIAVSKTKKNNTGRSRENTLKKAGCGTWVAKSKPEQITDCDDNVIGERRYLVFKINDNDAVKGSQFGSFRMHEYCLSGINQMFDPSRTHVICKITHESSKKLMCSEIADFQSNSASTQYQSNSASTLIEPIQDINELGEGLFFNDQGGEDDLCLDEDLCFDEDWIAEILKEDSVQGTTNHGKRKFEEECFCGTKKLCMA